MAAVLATSSFLVLVSAPCPEASQATQQARTLTLSGQWGRQVDLFSDMPNVEAVEKALQLLRFQRIRGPIETKETIMTRLAKIDNRDIAMMAGLSSLLGALVSTAPQWLGVSAPSNAVVITFAVLGFMGGKLLSDSLRSGKDK